MGGGEYDHNTLHAILRGLTVRLTVITLECQPLCTQKTYCNTGCKLDLRYLRTWVSVVAKVPVGFS